MAITVAQKSKAYRTFEGDGMKFKFVTIDLGVYATNGIAIAPSNCGMDHIFMVFFQAPVTTNIKDVVYDATNKKVKAFSDRAGTEVAASTDCSGQLINAIVVGV